MDKLRKKLSVRIALLLRPSIERQYGPLASYSGRGAGVRGFRTTLFYVAKLPGLAQVEYDSAKETKDT